jgi:hypothetical protein
MLLLTIAVFAGSAACRPCHAQIVDKYAKTPMARSSGRVDRAPAGQFSAAGHRYRVENNRLYFAQGSAPLDYFVGSNTAGRSYLFAREGYLFELPVTWYQRKRAWDASPGYEDEPDVRLDRAIDPTCLSCHSSRLQPIYGTQNRYADPPFLEDGVACERCHGPGSEHIRNPADAAMVNPTKLGPEERDSICAQCHLTGEARIERRGRRFAEFRPGQRLSDFVTYFVWAPKNPMMRVTSHVEKLAMSACKRSVGDSLWCGTCHDVHANANRTQAACIGCHRTAHHRDESCAECHMPSAKTVDVAHGVATNHDIERSWLPRSTTNKRRELQPFLGEVDTRGLGLAYAAVGDPRAREYLLRAKPADAPILIQLAALGQDPIRNYEAALQEDPSNPVALVNLGALYAQTGKLGDSAQVWERALDVNPAIEAAALNLARIRAATEARAVLERYLMFNPGSSSARSALRALR